MRPLASVVIMCCNFADFATEAVNSVLAQETEYPFEVIVIDDASSDGTRDILASLPVDARLRIFFHKENRGCVETANEGFSLAEGEFIGRLDGDDRYRSHFLQTSIDLLRKYPEVGMTYGDVATIDTEGRITEDRSTRVTPWKSHDSVPFKGRRYLPLIFDNCIPAPSILARREAWNAGLPIPKELTFIDWYLNLRIARKYELYYIPKVLAEYRIHDNNMHSNIPKNRSFERTLIAILDQIFEECDHAEEKRIIKAKAYALAYLNCAHKYGSWGMHKDAKRCALKAIKIDPASFDTSAFKTLIKSMLG
jgi:glycosyltransferase involved in cell wall biosynthesis